MFKVELKIEVSAQRVADMVTGAIEGGSVDWCMEYDIPRRKVAGHAAYSEASAYEGDFKIVFTDDEGTRHALDRAAVENGIQVMAEEYRWHFDNMMQETDDAVTADVFLQCCLFGEVVYG